MSDNYTFDLGVEAVKTGGADAESRQLLDLWERTKGIVHDDLVDISPLLLILNGANEGKPLPDLMLCGTQALATRLLGDDWAEAPAKAVGLLQEEYVELIGRGYNRSIQEHKPVFELVSTTLQYGNDPELNLKYQRLILPFQTLGGATFLFCYSHDVGTTRKAKAARQDGKAPLGQLLRDVGHASPQSLAASPK